MDGYMDDTQKTSLKSMNTKDDRLKKCIGNYSRCRHRFKTKYERCLKEYLK